ncbi:Molybdenum-pterin-binding protein MopA [Marinomonas aquimarina]|uniref:Molybdenum-pterin-binding protein MopA n=1 Tax=Marinomonas aquimarina TaxID=295068 RepID=A0A1A8TF38_9GAMM|nr:TOBE domain-containing protein [Marinomonas aquimarina]SBS30480.1 Molybdenum-pterin-binding protein MopA [Marinomonas aquimarina]
MSTSARNQFNAIIRTLNDGAVNSEVILDIGAEQSLVAIITQASRKSHDLKVGQTCTALIKASSVILSSDTKITTSARNKLVGTISTIETGAVNSDITLDIGGGLRVSAVVTNASTQALGLAVGNSACALFKAPSVILMVS